MDIKELETDNENLKSEIKKLNARIKRLENTNVELVTENNRLQNIIDSVRDYIFDKLVKLETMEREEREKTAQ